MTSATPITSKDPLVDGLKENVNTDQSGAPVITTRTDAAPVQGARLADKAKATIKLELPNGSKTLVRSF